MLRYKRKNSYKWRVILVIFIIFIGTMTWFLAGRLEGKAPDIIINQLSEITGSPCEISGRASDLKNGIRNIKISLFKDGRDYMLLNKIFPAESFMGKSQVIEYDINLKIDTKKFGISDGNATLRINSSDHSWRNWWNGNKAYKEIKIIFDTKPPNIDVLTHAHNISQGGAGVIIYRVSEENTKNGVHVGKNFFKGYSGYFKEPLVYMAFFAINYNQGTDTELSVIALDKAGNRSRSGVYYNIRRKTFQKDNLNISDRFLKWKMSEFQVETPPSSKPPLVVKFLQINRELRKKNFEIISSACKNPDKKIYWQGSFLRLPKSANRAGFADHRSYYYNGKIIDKQIHMGIDLASLAHSPVPAANSGKIIFKESVGIYGKTIIIDHGFGLFSMYSHLSRFNIENGQKVSKGEIIGYTGTTGMAGGDHLHFSMIVQGVFCNPIEWWDAKWIRDNITEKISSVDLEIGQ
ncbi:Peptidase M23 domain-containing protein [Candidatus Magnetomoraceae bacterium gMMP-15]